MTDNSEIQPLPIAVPVRENLHKLPQAPPEVPFLEFTGQGGEWPPKPWGVTEFKPVHAQEVLNSLTDELEQKVRTAALRDGRVRELLGERFAHINSDLVQTGKGQNRNCAEPLSTRLIFFSHINNVAIEVLMKGSYVQDVSKMEGYQPPEGSDEIVEAICLARSDIRIKDQVQLLSAHAILLPNAVEDIGYGHRRMWVTFTDSADT